MAILQKMADFFIRNLTASSPALYRHFGTESHSGKVVSIDSALTLATVWSCVRLIAETAATLPLGVYRRGPAGAKLSASDHWLYPLLHDAPNADQTAVEFFEGLFACVALWGNGYAYKDMAGRRVISLTPLRPDWMDVRRNADGAIEYRYHDPIGGFRIFNEDEIFHLRGFGTGDIVGLSPIRYARHSLGNAMSVEEAVGTTFKNGLRPAGALTVDQILKKEQRKDIRDSLAEQVSGVANSGKLMVLEAGMKYTPLSMPPEDAQMLETRRFHVEDICRWFRVPPHMVGHTEKSTSWGSGIEQQNIGFLAYALRPYLTRLEQTVRKSLVPVGEKGIIYAEYNLEGLLRADSAGRAAFYSQMAQNGIYTRNEIRARENLPPVAGGDELTVQVNLTPISKLGAVPAPAPIPNEVPQ